MGILFALVSLRTPGGQSASFFVPGTPKDGYDMDMSSEYVDFISKHCEAERILGDIRYMEYGRGKSEFASETQISQLARKGAELFHDRKLKNIGQKRFAEQIR